MPFGRHLALLVAALALTLSQHPAAAQVTNVYDITGLIDVADLLILQGNTLQWHHPGSGAAVGRHGGANDPTTISTSSNSETLMNDIAWTPTWPSPPPNEIRFDAYSSIYSNLTPALPSGSVAVQTTVLSGRGSVSINQFPDETNNFTLIVRFADGANGAALLTVRITVTIRSISIAQLSSSELQVSWPADDPSFFLESTPTLVPSSWTIDTHDVFPVGNRFIVRVNPSEPQRYFRLHRP